MQADAYRRARRLLSGSPSTVILARILGVVHSLLILALVAVAGLFTALLDRQGEARIPTRELSRAFHLSPSAAEAAEEPVESLDTPPRTAGRDDWIFSRMKGALHVDEATGEQVTYFEDSGLLPLVTSNVNSPVIPHRFGARVVKTLLRGIPTLRNNLGALTTLLATALALTLALCLIGQYRRSVLADAACDVATTLRRQIHRQMYRLGQSALPTEGTGPIINVMTREVNDIRDGLFAELDNGYRMPVLAAGLIVFLLFLSPLLTIVLTSLGGLMLLTARTMNRDARLIHDAAIRDAAVQLCLLHEDLTLLRTVRVFGMERVENERFDEHLERFRAADARRIETEGKLNPTMGLLYGVVIILAVGLLGYNVMVTHRLSPASALVLFVSLVGLAHPTLEWLKMRKAIRQANRSGGAVFEFLERRPELQQPVGAQFLSPLHDRITFENVSLESRSGRVLLEGVSLEVPAGTRTAIMSLDEDAKHAMVCLIPRLIDPKVGRVRIDGHDLRDVTLESIRAQVATVLQADLVFTDSVLVNIGLGDESYELPRIIEAAKVAHAHNFIQDLPHGYDTIIGPLGHYLKPDEQYRIALARAFLHDPSIVIIEEPSVALDEETKHLIDDTISRLSENRTLIVLPHRLSTIRSCDQIVILHGGRIESIGKPRQLQNESKLFRHIQYVEFNQFATGEIEAGQMNA